MYKLLAVFCGALLLSACGTVYKDHSSRVFDAQQNFFEALDKSHQQLAKSIDDRRLAKIAADPDFCSVSKSSQIPFYLIRPLDVAPYVKNIPAIASTDECRALLACTNGNSTCDGSKVICLNNAQRVCVTSAVTLTAEKNKKAELAEIIASGVVPGSRIKAQQFISDGIEVSTEYVSLLGKLSKPSKPEIDVASASLIKNLTKLKANLDKVNAVDAAKDLGVATKEINEYLTPVTSLISVIGKISEDWDQQKKIVEHVKNGGDLFSKTLDAILPFASTDENLAKLINESNTINSRESLMVQLEKEKNPSKREQLLKSLVSIPDQAQAGKNRASAVASSGEALKTAHGRLVLLITNPDESQREAIQKEVFDNLALVFKKLSAVVSLF